MSAPDTTADLPSRNFQPRIYGVGAWTDHLHFACDLIALVRPRLLVELGTDRGESYFAFCQSALENETGTRCVAVDTWRGDVHAGEYDETTYAEVAQHNRQHYENFSTLLRATFDDARAHFADESVDVLHLDGLHTEEAVRHDIENWLPKIRPGGLLLMHDTSVRSRRFGVWKIWRELAERGRAYAFADGPGLGVWQKPPTQELPTPLENLFAGAPELTEYYRVRAQQTQARLTQHWRDRSIREIAAGAQTAVQVFHTRDGIHREEDSVFARLGHERWTDLTIPLPPGAGSAPLRVDFLSAYTTIDLTDLRLTSEGKPLWSASFDEIRLAGDVERVPHSRYLRLQITGPDPQLHLPIVESPEGKPLRLQLRLRVSADRPAD